MFFRCGDADDHFQGCWADIMVRLGCDFNAIVGHTNRRVQLGSAGYGRELEGIKIALSTVSEITTETPISGKTMHIVRLPIPLRLHRQSSYWL